MRVPRSCSIASNISILFCQKKRRLTTSVYVLLWWFYIKLSHYSSLLSSAILTSSFIILFIPSPSSTRSLSNILSDHIILVNFPLWTVSVKLISPNPCISSIVESLRSSVKRTEDQKFIGLFSVVFGGNGGIGIFRSFIVFS